MEHSKLPFVARGSHIEDADGLLVADTNQSCGLTRGLDLSNAEMLAKSANLYSYMLGALNRVAAIESCIEQHGVLNWKEVCAVFQVVKAVIAKTKK